MKKIFLIAVAALLATTALNAQDLKDVKEKLNGAHRPGFAGTFNYSKSEMETVVKQHMKDAGLKSKSSDGFMSYMGVSYKDINPGQSDIYLKVTGDKQSATVILLVSTGYDTFLTKEIENNAKAFMKALAKEAKENAIKAQEKVLEKATKEHASAIKNLESLEKEKVKLEEKIENAKKEISAKAEAKANEETVLKKLNDR